MNRSRTDSGCGFPTAPPAIAGPSRDEPGWVVVLLIVVFLSVLALPKSITTSGLDPIVIVVSAVILVFAMFGKD
jgi:hypothetical protein